MVETRFLCLAVSRRDGGNCIAGIDLNSGKWVRPIHPKTHGAFADHELIVVDKADQTSRFLTALDVFDVQLDHPVGNDAQPENWEVCSSYLEKPVTVLYRFDRKSDIDRLASFLDRSDPLLHTFGDSISEFDIHACALTKSLALIHPRRVLWHVSENSRCAGKFRVRGEFAFARTTYNLVVTDPNWESECRTLGFGTHPQAKLSCHNGDDIFLTISIAAVPFHGLHYKLVAGVICLPNPRA